VRSSTPKALDVSLGRAAISFSSFVGPWRVEVPSKFDLALAPTGFLQCGLLDLDGLQDLINGLLFSQVGLLLFRTPLRELMLIHIVVEGIFVVLFKDVGSCCLYLTFHSAPVHYIVEAEILPGTQE